jgi:hypothetical protein
LTIWARAVSAPTAVATTVRTPLVFTVAPATMAPSDFSTGTDSPVSIDSSTAGAPSTTRPSVGIFSPGRTRMWSPTTTLVDRYHHLPAVTDDTGLLGAELEKGADGLPGPPLGPGLEVAAEHQEGDEQGGDLEVQLPAEEQLDH